jgi:hypothetical protein
MKDTIKVGDVVAIRGDRRINNNGQCAYTPDQLFQGKYVKHAYNGEIWTGVVKKIDGDMALVGGGWRQLDSYEVVCNGY